DRAALAAMDVLRLVEAERAEIADGAEWLAAVAGEQALRRVFDHLQAVPPRDRHDFVHLAANARVVDGGDRDGLGGDRGLDEPFVEIEGVLADVDEHW